MTKSSASNEPSHVTPSLIAEAIGRALLTWHNNETASAHLFAALINAGNRNAAIAAFYAVNGFSQRLAVLKSTARVVSASNANIDDVSLVTLLDRLADANRLRNRLSHSEVRKTFADGRYQYFLEVPDAAWTGGKQKDRRIDAATIFAAEAEFRTLAEDIAAYIDSDLAEDIG